MTTNDSEPVDLDLHVSLPSAESLDELERVILKARASELTEVRRRDMRLRAGYGDDTTRDVMTDEGRRARIRYDALDALLEAIRRATG